MSKIFLHFFGEVENVKERDMGIEKPSRLPVDIYIDPTTVISVNETINDDGEIEGCTIGISSGGMFWVSDSTKTVLNRCGIRIDDK